MMPDRGIRGAASIGQGRRRYGVLPWARWHIPHDSMGIPEEIRSPFFWKIATLLSLDKFSHLR